MTLHRIEPAASGAADTQAAAALPLEELLETDALGATELIKTYKELDMLYAWTKEKSQAAAASRDNTSDAMDEAERAAVRGAMVGFVFQTFQLLGSLSALENVMLPAELRGEASALNNAKALLERVGLGHRLQHYPRQLSGGEQQRVAIARAFASNPSILFADEPTGNLDSKTGDKIIDLLFELNADFGTTLVLVTHDSRLAALCDASIRIEAGQLVEEAGSGAAAASLVGS